MKIGLDDKCVLLGNQVDLNVLWFELSKQIKLAQEDLVIKDQLNEAISSII